VRLISHAPIRMMCCGAGVSPAGFPCPRIAKPAGETPAPQNLAMTLQIFLTLPILNRLLEIPAKT